ncbi:hypothetical protein ACKKBG_A35390 [Auxenochlorella protothecoides x Auxenochlorella symbiontica]
MTDAAIIEAFNACRQDIINNLESLTLKSVRRRLEADLGLEVDSLKVKKAFISDLIDKLIASQAVATPASQESEPVAVAKKEPPIQPPAKRAKPEKKRADEGAKAPEPKPVVKTPALTDQGSQSGGARRQLSSATLRLREMCKRATIGIAPSIYVQNKTDAGLQEALVNLLTKHGLSKSSGSDAVEAVARRLAKERDLDGIDTSNIVSGGRRRQPVQAPRTYKAASDSEDSSSSEEDPESDSDESSVSEVEPAEDAVKAPASASAKEPAGKQRRVMPAQNKATAADPSSSSDAASSGDESSESEEVSTSEDEESESSEENKNSNVAGGKAPTPTVVPAKKAKASADAPSKRRIMVLDSDDE